MSLARQDENLSDADDAALDCNVERGPGHVKDADDKTSNQPVEEEQAHEGDYYNPRLKEHHQVCSMPANTWGSCILSSLMYKHWFSGHPISGEFFIVFGLQVLGLFMTVWAQFFLIRFLGNLAASRHDTDSPAEECNPRYGQETFLCTLILLGQIMSSELRETVSMWKFVWQIPLRKKAQLDIHDKEDDDKKPLVVLRWENQDKGIAQPVTGIYWWHLSFICLVLCAKFLLALWLGLQSYDFIMYTEDDHEILLNCTATLFILEIDDIVFRVINPKGFQKMFEDYPAFRDPALDERFNHWTEMLTRIMRCCCRKEQETQETKQNHQKRKSIMPDGGFHWLQYALDGSLSTGSTFLANLILYQFYCTRSFVHFSVDQDTFYLRFWQHGLTFSLALLGMTVVAAVLIWAVAVGCDQLKAFCSCKKRYVEESMDTE